MTEPVSINPEGLRNAANQFDAISDTTRQILNTLTGGCNAEGEPWGDDKAGKKFSEGDKGYIANRDGTFKNLGQLVDLFGQNRDNLRDSAKTFEQNEATAAANATHQNQNGPSGSGNSSGSGSYGPSSYSPNALYRRMEMTRLTPRQEQQQLQPEEALRRQDAQPLQPREYNQGTPLQPREYNQGTPLQPREYDPQQPLQPREYTRGVPATEVTPEGYTYSPEQPLQPRQYYAQQGIPTTEPRLYDSTEGTPLVYGQTQPRYYEATAGTPEVYGQTLQPREYSAEIPAVEGDRVEATPEQPLQREQVFPRIQDQPVQDPNQA
ncbi:uncharacterized protein YukE [Nocardia sp. GAS34]|uniref:WXG100 family type VII secretion target n=1 Tax=unclassified Nocardia TaxID=2637762 RepID=UPI003D1F4033